MTAEHGESPLLYELADGRFQLMTRGAIGPLLCGYRYLLVEEPLADFLDYLQMERVIFEPALLFNPATGDEVRGHVRVRVGQWFDAGAIRDLPLSGPRLLTLNDRYYFASPTLKEALEAASFPYLRFSEGLSGFA